MFLQLWQNKEGEVGEIVDCLDKFRAGQSTATAAIVAVGPISIRFPPLKRIHWFVAPFVVEVEEEEDAGKDGEGKVEKNQSDEGKDCHGGDPFKGAIFGFFVIFEG